MRRLAIALAALACVSPIHVYAQLTCDSFSQLTATEQQLYSFGLWDGYLGALSFVEMTAAVTDSIADIAAATYTEDELSAEKKTLLIDGLRAGTRHVYEQLALTTQKASLRTHQELRLQLKILCLRPENANKNVGQIVLYAISELTD